ncbi:MAG: hypothetical protein IJW32_04500 [Clostridia bacterium]|nr:hypothetical protein [Clostridia bacterium]
MLINNNYPKASVYYISYLILKSIKKFTNYFDVYYDVKQKVDINLGIYNQCLDYLFIINKVMVEKNGEFRCL